MILKELKAFLKPDIHKSYFKSVKWKTTAFEDENVYQSDKPKIGKMIVDLKLIEEEKQHINIDKLLDDSFELDEIEQENQDNKNENQEEEIDNEKNFEFNSRKNSEYGSRKNSEFNSRKNSAK